MSWSLYAMPLHHVASDGGWEWAASAGSVRDLPDQPPEPTPPARVGDVLDALRAAGCHGTAWFEVDGLAAGSALPRCPDAGTCGIEEGPDLGEVSLHVAGQERHGQPLPIDAAVAGVSFRKPNTLAVLRVMCALTSAAGPLLVHDDSADQVFVVWPGERAEDMRGEWPW
ncbi:hypothetical protein [Plantactinospora sonchi]|uniref:Uncharacterized protein n=1 Tax=Plantactinospora sonchi TaxID=1544735 RepID=A0ABU7RKR3_9ACTN